MTPDAIAPLFLLAAGLLVVAGAVKLSRPRATAQALVDVGLPGSDAAARVLGAVEVGTGVWALLAPGLGGAIALALAYLGFAGFLGYVLRSHPEAGSCGCAGAKAVPPSRLHLGLNVLAAGAGIAYAAVAGPSAETWLASLGPAGALGVVTGLLLAGWLAAVAVTEVPVAWSSWIAPVHRDDGHHHHDEHGRADEALARAGIGPGHPSLWPGTDAEAVG